MGYTSAGVECWNAMRALDYLQTRPEIDSSRLGVTGRSGGGATSWWIAAADERIKAAVPVAGISDLQAHLLEGIEPRLRKGVITGHCDCMYFINLYRWDFTQLIALCAPRAVLLGNSDEDPIFPKPGYLRMVDKVKKIYALLNAPDSFALLETKGGHVDTAELRRGINAWMNKWLKGDTNPPAAEKPIKFEPKQLKVLIRYQRMKSTPNCMSTLSRKLFGKRPIAIIILKKVGRRKVDRLLLILSRRSFVIGRMINCLWK